MRQPLLIALFTIALTPLAAAQTDGEAPLQLAEKMPVWSTCSNATDQATCTAQTVATFISERVSYDRKMKKRGLEGTVIVRFVVERDGSIGDIEIVRGVDPALDDQVVEAVGNFPAFQPGEQRGKAVRVQYALPVRFSL